MLTIGYVLTMLSILGITALIGAPFLFSFAGLFGVALLSPLALWEAISKTPKAFIRDSADVVPFPETHNATDTNLPVAS